MAQKENVDNFMAQKIPEFGLQESRAKTVSCLMAGGVRDMVRPGRLAQLQHIVKTLNSHTDMARCRKEMTDGKMTDEEKTAAFLTSFKKAHSIVFK